MKKKIISILVAVSFLLSLVGCNVNLKTQNGSTNNTHQTTPSNYTQLTEEEVEEIEFEDAEKIMKKHIDENRVMIKEIDFYSDENDRKLFSKIHETLKPWLDATKFAGYQSGSGVSFHMKHFPPKQYYLFQQMYLSLNKSDKMLQYNVFFRKNFENINSERFVTFIKGIYGVDISMEELQNKISDCALHLDEVTKERQYWHTLYNQDGVVIKTIAMQDHDGQKYVVLFTKYIPQ